MTSKDLRNEEGEMIACPACGQQHMSISARFHGIEHWTCPDLQEGQFIVAKPRRLENTELLKMLELRKELDPDAPDMIVLNEK